MKTLKPVDEETYAKIGKAYLICSEYPEVFGDVTFQRFCSMFVDVVEDDREARMKESAPEMYEMLKSMVRVLEMDGNVDEADGVKELLERIDGREVLP